MGNLDQIPFYFDISSNLTVNKKGEETIFLKLAGYEKSRIISDELYVILKRNTVPKGKLFPRIVFGYKEKVGR